MLSLSPAPTNCTPIYAYTRFNPPFPEHPHHARITKPAKRSVNQINKKRLSSQNIHTENLKTRFNKGKDDGTTVFSSASIQPLLVFTMLREIPCWEGRFATASLSCWSQAPSHTLVQNPPFLSRQPISHFPLPAHANLHLGKLRAHHLLLLRSPQTLTWPFAGTTAPRSLGGSPAFAPVCLCSSK